MRDRFVRIAFDEHASIAAFAQTILKLLALGAEAMLIERTSAALRDEVNHARLAFELVGRMGELARAAPGPLPEAIALSPAGGPEDLARQLLLDVLVGGCVGETLSVLAASDLAEHAPLEAQPFLSHRD